MERIGDVVVKTLISIQPSLAHVYQSCCCESGEAGSLRCFEILGFDVMVDRKYRPWLIEVNHSPSFTCDSPLDARIKSDLISNTMRLLNLHPLDRRRHQKQQTSQAKSRLYSGVNGPGIAAKQSTQRLSLIHI